MAIKGELLIGGESFSGKGTAFFAIEQTTGNRLGGAFHGATPDKVDEALALSWEAFGTYPKQRWRNALYFLNASLRISSISETNWWTGPA